jgi:hypothetical protein
MAPIKLPVKLCRKEKPVPHHIRVMAKRSNATENTQASHDLCQPNLPSHNYHQKPLAFHSLQRNLLSYQTAADPFLH